jgi:hypothetical protein
MDKILPNSIPVPIDRIHEGQIIYNTDGIPFVRFYKLLKNGEASYIRSYLAMVLSPNDYQYLRSKIPTNKEINEVNIINPKQRKYVGNTGSKYTTSTIIELNLIPSDDPENYKKTLFILKDIPFIPILSKKLMYNYILEDNRIPDVYSIDKIPSLPKEVQDDQPKIKATYTKPIKYMKVPIYQTTSNVKLLADEWNYPTMPILFSQLFSKEYDAIDKKINEQINKNQGIIGTDLAFFFGKNLMEELLKYLSITDIHTGLTRIALSIIDGRESRFVSGYLYMMSKYLPARLDKKTKDILQKSYDTEKDNIPSPSKKPEPVIEPKQKLTGRIKVPRKLKLIEDPIEELDIPYIPNPVVEPKKKASTPKPKTPEPVINQDQIRRQKEEITEMLDTITITKMKELLKNNKLSTTGKRNDLLIRLQESQLLPLYPTPYDNLFIPRLTLNERIRGRDPFGINRFEYDKLSGPEKIKAIEAQKQGNRKIGEKYKEGLNVYGPEYVRPKKLREIKQQQYPRIEVPTIPINIYENDINLIPNNIYRMNTEPIKNKRQFKQPRKPKMSKTDKDMLKEIKRLTTKFQRINKELSKRLDKIDSLKTKRGKINSVIIMKKRMIEMNNVYGILQQLLPTDNDSVMLIHGFNDIRTDLSNRIRLYENHINPSPVNNIEMNTQSVTPQPKIAYITGQRQRLPPKTILVSGIPKSRLTKSVAIPQDLPEIVTQQPETPILQISKPTTPKPVVKSKKIKPFRLNDPPDIEDYTMKQPFGMYNNTDLVFKNVHEYIKSIITMYEAFRIFTKNTIIELINTQIKNPTKPIIIDYFYGIYSNVAKELYDLRKDTQTNYEEIEKLDLIESTITDIIFVEFPEAFWSLDKPLLIQFLKDILTYMNNTSSQKDKTKIVELYFTNYKFIPKPYLKTMIEDYQIDNINELINTGEEYIEKKQAEHALQEDNKHRIEHQKRETEYYAKVKKQQDKDDEDDRADLLKEADDYKKFQKQQSKLMSDVDKYLK